MTRLPPSKARINLSLRVWSRQTPLEAIVSQLGLEISHSHIPEKPMAERGPLSKQIARRFYVSAGNTDVETDEDAISWLQLILKKLSCSSISEKLITEEIETTLWVAIFGEKFRPLPKIPSKISSLARELGASLLIENYTDFEEGEPKKSWLVRK